MKKQLIKLIEVKSILTFAVIGTLCALAARQNVEVSSEMFAAVVSSIVTFYFTRQKQKDTTAIENLPVVRQEEKEE